MEHFSNTLAYLRTKGAYELKNTLFQWGGILPATVATISFVCLYLKCCSPNNQTISKWSRFHSIPRFGPCQSCQVLKK